MRQASSLGNSYGTAPGASVWQRRLDAECANSAHNGSPFAVVLIELDGAARGDEPETPISAGAVALTIEGLRRCTRPHDLVCQLGATSLAVLLVDCDAANAAVVLERLLRSAARELAGCLPPGMRPELRAGWAACPAEGAAAGALLYTARARLRGAIPAAAAQPVSDSLAPLRGLGRRLFRQRAPLARDSAA